MAFLKTSERIAVENYPYGYQRTTLFDYMEFDPKKGYRRCSQTINPKTGQLNKPKKGTYSPLQVRYYDENGHIKSKVFWFNGTKELIEGVKFMAEHFDMFSEAEIKYIYGFCLSMSLIDMRAKVVYCGSTLDSLKPLYDNFIKNAKEGMQTASNLFADMILDIDAINTTKDADFQPFKITTHN